jgi:membrane fusion protein (multidrug efflux system)
MNKMYIPSTVLFIAAAFLFFILPACGKKESKAPEERIISVKAQVAEKRSVRPYVETTGSLNPFEEVIVSAEVDGIIRDLRVEEGTAVSRGMLLAVISETDYELDVRRSEAALKQAEASLSNTSLEFKRKEALYKEQLVTQQQFDDVTTRLSLAEAELERAKSTLSLAKQKLLKTKIYSPIDGFVKEKKATAGNYARNGSNLFVVIKNNPLKLIFTVSEKEIGRLKKNQDVIFRVDAFGERQFKGKVSIVYPSLDEKTRSLQVEALTPNPDGTLKPGLFAKVILYTGEAKESILIPSIALLHEGEQVRAFVSEEGVAKSRVLKIGQQYKLTSSAAGSESNIIEYTEILEGIKEGETVITVGQQNLSQNTKIKIVNTP